MCGIVGAVAQRNVVPILIEGLRRLEYRGYDSAGLAVIDAADAVPALSRLAHRPRRRPGRAGRGQPPRRHSASRTRAGPPTARPPNATPIRMPRGGRDRGRAQRHHREPRGAARAAARRRATSSQPQTDTEVIAHLVHAYWHAAAATCSRRAARGRRTAGRLRDRRDLAAASRSTVVGARAGRAAAWRRPAAAGRELPRLRHLGAAAGDPSTSSISKKATSSRSASTATRSSTRTASRSSAPMHREPAVGRRGRARAPTATTCRRRSSSSRGAIADTLEMVTGARALPGLFGADAEDDLRARRQQVLILACGTSYHAGLVAKYWLEAIAGIPATVEIASEYRYRDPCRIPTRW